MEMITSTLKPTLLLDTVLMKARSTALNHAAARKRKHNVYSRSLEAEQKHISDVIFSAAGMEEELNNQINTQKKLSQIHPDAETPTMSFCAQITIQKKKIPIAHLMRKREKIPQEKRDSPTEEAFKDLFETYGKSKHIL